MTVVFGDCRETLRAQPAGAFRCCVTSPPYWGLRDYGHSGQLGLEETPEAYVEAMVSVFREVWRVLADDGTLWLNLGDSYAHGGCGARDQERWPKQSRNDHMPRHAKKGVGLPPKSLVGIPWRVALALQADGWLLRSDIVWSKPNPMPESVRDRPTKSHEYVFLLAKSDGYFYDASAVAEDAQPESAARYAYAFGGSKAEAGRVASAAGVDMRTRPIGDRVYSGKRNARSVWSISVQPFAGAHFATMPADLAERCVLAGSAPGDTVLDPFLGSGTVGMVAERNGRRWFGCELNEAYAPLIAERTAQLGLRPSEVA